MIEELTSERELEQESDAWDFIEHFRSQIKELDRARKESEKKAAEYLDKLQRLQADMENLRKLTNRQLESVTKQAAEGLMTKLLPILDALDQAGKIAHSDKQLPTEEIAVGLKMLTKQLLDILRSEGLEEVASLGYPFDPERHEAVSFVESDHAPENIVVDEVLKGYVLNGKIIRPSMVVVSKKRTSKNEKAEKSE